ncbi:hypothetical protein C8Q77DRAFT_830420 [Trametes polyzona]|nr:hypothetical protein C8Q77DRAFT_830420 [Trametes polyzona]
MDPAPPTTGKSDNGMDRFLSIADLLIAVLRLLDIGDLVVCRRVCRSWNSLFQMYALRYRLSLARSGMVDGSASDATVSSRRRLTALEDYHRARGRACFVEDQCPQRASSTIPAFSGSAIPFVTGNNVQLLRPACSERSLPEKTWHFKLDKLDMGPEYCAVDITQYVLALFTFRRAGSTVLHCHILSLESSVVTYRSDTPTPILSIPAHRWALDPYTIRAAISGDLLAWQWQDACQRLRVYNWKTGAVVWRPHRGIILFAFLGNSVLAVSNNGASSVRAYLIDPEASVDTSYWPREGVTPPTGYISAKEHIFLLPETAAGNTASIYQMVSRPSLVCRDDKTLFDHDPDFAVLAISTRCSFRTVCGSRPEEYRLFVPARALSSHVINAREDSRACGDSSGAKGIPWNSWGMPYSRILLPSLRERSLEPEGYLLDSYTMGSKHVFVIHHRLARPSRQHLAQYVDVSDVVVHDLWGTFLGDLPNKLPFNVVHKSLEYVDESLHTRCTAHVMLLDDNLVIRLPKRGDGTTHTWLSLMLTV